MKNLKKLLIIVFIGMLIASLVTIVACTPDDPVDEHKHTLVKTDAKAATCDEAGNVEYWHCSGCNKNFTSQAATEEINDVTLPAGHDFTVLQHSADGHWNKCSRCDETTALEAHKGGTATHSQKAKCEVCEEEYGTTTTNHVYNKEVVEEKYLASEATCEHKATYYKSCECGEFDEDGATFEAGELGAHKLDKVEAEAPDHDNSGILEHWNCSVCGKNFTSEDADEEMASVTDPALGHTYDQEVAEAKFLETEATCEHKATYYKSCECGKFDAEGDTFESGEYAQHQVEKIDAVAPGCETDGNVEYWHCSVCEKNFATQDADEEISDVTAPAHHELEEHEKIAWKEAGYVKHWDCSVCDKVFADENGEVVTSHEAVTVQAVAAPSTDEGEDVFVGDVHNNKAFMEATNWYAFKAGNYSGYTTGTPSLESDNGVNYLKFNTSSRFDLFRVVSANGSKTHLGENAQGGSTQWGNTGNFADLYDNTFIYTFDITANGAFAFEVFGLDGGKADRTGQGTSLLFNRNTITFFAGSANGTNNQTLRAIATLPEDFNIGDGAHHTITLSIKRSTPNNSATVTDYRIYIDGYMVRFVNQVNSSWNVANQDGIIQINIGSNSGMGQRLSVIPQINSEEGADVTTYTEVCIYGLIIKRHRPETTETENLAMIPECIVAEKYAY